MLFQFGEDIISLHDEASTTFLSRRGATEYLRLNPIHAAESCRPKRLSVAPERASLPAGIFVSEPGSPQPGDIE
jgi:hypothetical protein